MNEDVPQEAQREWLETEKRHMDAWMAFAKKWPNFAKEAAYSMLGGAVALVDVLGGDVEGFLTLLRNTEPRPDFRIVPDPRARS